MFNQAAKKLSKVTVELKNDLEISGSLASVDQYLNIFLNDIEVNDAEKYPQFQNTQSCFIRGNSIRYIHFNKADINYEVFEEACRQST